MRMVTICSGLVIYRDDIAPANFRVASHIDAVWPKSLIRLIGIEYPLVPKNEIESSARVKYRRERRKGEDDQNEACPGSYERDGFSVIGEFDEQQHMTCMRCTSHLMGHRSRSGHLNAFLD